MNIETLIETKEILEKDYLLIKKEVELLKLEIDQIKCTELSRSNDWFKKEKGITTEKGRESYAKLQCINQMNDLIDLKIDLKKIELAIENTCILIDNEFNSE